MNHINKLMESQNFIYHIACSTDDKYAQHCGIMLYSLLDNNQKHTFHIHILIECLNDDNKNNLIDIVSKYGAYCTFHVVNTQLLQGVKFRTKNPLSLAAYYRLLFTSMIDAEIEKILYLDCDIIVINDITSLWDINLTTYSLAAVRDSITLPQSELHRSQLGISYGGDYFNSGVMLINLQYWREHFVEEKLIKFAQKDRFVFFHDQDALNYLFKDSWYKLSPKWNRMNMAVLEDIYFPTNSDKLDFLLHPCIIHYASSNDYKPWKKTNLLPLGKYYKKYKNETIWKDTELEAINISYLSFYRNVIIVHLHRILNNCPFIIRFLFFLLRDILSFILSILNNKIYISKSPF